jgi:glycosyltransferase involved in cell wall biosynthesis
VRRLNELPCDLDVRLLSMLERKLILKSQHVVANSNMLADICARDLRIPRARIEVLPLGIDCQRFSPRDSHFRKQLGIGDRPVILFSGRLERRKGIDTLLEAMGKVRERRPDAVLVLAGGSTCTASGDRDFKREIEVRFQSWIAAGALHLLGAIPYEDLPDIYAGCDVLAVPSPFESFGMVYLEAMACGKPVIGCQTGGAGEVIAHEKTGFLVPPSQASPLAERLLALIDDESLRLRMGTLARAHTLEHFESKRIAQRSAEIYQGILRDRRGYARIA